MEGIPANARPGEANQAMTRKAVIDRRIRMAALHVQAKPMLHHAGLNAQTIPSSVDSVELMAVQAPKAEMSIGDDFLENDID